ncbi:MAG: RDD family protein [Gammaproteobacteria bacterium]|nr:MAG: RDD family protein [Gammaproteobacteria bacterium]
MEQQITNGAGGAAEPRYVGFWARFLAMLIDNLWVSLLLALFVMAFLGDDFMAYVTMVSGGSMEMADMPTQSAGVSILAQLLLPAVLIVGFWVWKSATPGKMVISAEIVDAKTLGKPSTGQLIARYIGYFISFFVFGLGFLWVAFDKRKQGWHDKIAGTLVVKK